jgi:L-lactate dehydrogenase (cytochrome)
MLDRAGQAGYEAIVLTVDTPVLGRRERDVRHGFALPPRLGPGTLIDGALHPGWTWRLLRSEPITFANVAGKAGVQVTDAVNLSEYIGAQFDPTLSWHDFEWFRSVWTKPIVVKGVQSVDDAVRAADLGADAVAVSNHGGRQLDGSPVPLELVAPVAAAVGERAQVICDGGIRRGSDIVKAVALGAAAAMIGRAYLYGLGAAGERGVDHVLDHLAEGMRRTMALIGYPTITDLSPAAVHWRSS